MENGYGALGQHAPKPVEQEKGPDWLQFAMEQDMVECHAVVMGQILLVVKVIALSSLKKRIRLSISTQSSHICS